MKTLVTLAAIAAASAATSVVLADNEFHLLTRWTFEVSVPTNAGPFVNEEGIVEGFASGVHANGATVWSNPVGNGSLESFSSNTWSEGDYYQFTTSTIGFESIIFGWSQTRSSTGPSDFDLLWSSDGLAFELLTEYMVPQIAWSSVTLNEESIFEPVALPAEAARLDTVWVRLVSNQTTALAGTNRVDDVFFSGVKQGDPTEPCVGDLNGDDLVDGADLGLLLGEWGKALPGELADINEDGVVDGADLGLLLGAWGPCSL
jgi:hypothetical protein